MAIKINKINNLVTPANGDITNITEYPNSFKRQGAFPLEKFSLFNSLTDAQAYAASNPVAYVGQELVVVTYTEGAISGVTAYLIADEAGTLQEVGKAPVGDDATISVAEDGTISLKGSDTATAGQVLSKTESGWAWTTVATSAVLGDVRNDVDGILEEIGADNEAATVKGRIKAIEDSVGAADGIAPLGEDSKVPAAYLPSYVDDVVEGYIHEGKFYEDEAHTKEITGESGKIYVDLTTNKTYRFGTTVFAEISASLAIGTTAGTAYDGAAGAAVASQAAQTASDLSGHVADDVRHITAEERSAWNTAAGASHVDSLNQLTGAVTIDADGYSSVSKDGNTIKISTSVPDVSDSASGLMTSALKSRLEGISEGAEVNYISSVETANFGVNDGKLSLTAVEQSKVTGLADALGDKLDSSTAANTYLALTGGTLSGNLTVANDDNSVVITPAKVTANTVEATTVTISSMGTGDNAGATKKYVDDANAALLGKNTDTASDNTIYGVKAAITDSESTLIGKNTDESSANTIYGAKKYADGAKSNVIGNSSDDSSADTVYGAKAYADAAAANVVGKSSDAATANTVYGAKAAASAAEQNAKDYVDTALASYDTSTQVDSKIGTAIGNAYTLEIKVVDTLPSISEAVTKAIYFVPTDAFSGSYVEWMVINGAWEKIGTTAADLTDYLKTNGSASALTVNGLDTLTSVEGIYVSEGMTVAQMAKALNNLSALAEDSLAHGIWNLMTTIEAGDTYVQPNWTFNDRQIVSVYAHFESGENVIVDCRKIEGNAPEFSIARPIDEDIIIEIIVKPVFNN